MDPKPGQFIELYFRNGLKKSGIVIEWTEKKSVIKNGDELLIIPQTLNDIFLIKIFSIKDNLETNDNKLADDNSKLRAKQLAELHLEKIKLEKEHLGKRIFSLDKTNTSEVTYGIPKHYSPTKPRSLINSGEEAPRRSKKDS